MTAQPCVYCGALVEHDETAEARLRRPVLVDLDAVDVDNPGTSCAESDTGEHATAELVTS